MKRKLEAIEAHESEGWNAALKELGGGHLLQSWQWGALKSRYGWTPQRILWKGADGRHQAAAQLLFRTVAGRWTVAYCPRGPLVDWSEPTLHEVILDSLGSIAHEYGALFLKIDPELVLGTGAPGEGDSIEYQETERLLQIWHQAGWRPSEEQIQFKNTMVIPLDQDEETLLMAMKSKTRYNIRLAGRRRVEVRRGGIEDVELLYKMYAETSVRDGFAIRNQGYYENAWGNFIKAGFAQPLIAEFEGQPVAGLIAYRFGTTAYYLYGMSTSEHREKMPNYLLQWEAMRWAKENGCTRYDLWGAPDEIDPNDPMYGVYRFKDGFGAKLVRTVGAWDLPLRPTLYLIYSRTMPVILSFMRTIGRIRTRQAIDN